MRGRASAAATPPRDPQAVAALGGSSGAPVTTGGDYACRERVFAPPVGTLDVDWVAPAVAEACPDATLEDVRAAVVGAWTAVRSLVASPGGRRPDDVTAVLDRLATAGHAVTALDRAAATVVVDAVRLFAVH